VLVSYPEVWDRLIRVVLSHGRLVLLCHSDRLGSIGTNTGDDFDGGILEKE
jgi:hypothetical protein